MALTLEKNINAYILQVAKILTKKCHESESI